MSANSPLLGERADEVKTDVLAIRGKTLVFGNSVYALENVSILQIHQFSGLRDFPKWVGGTMFLGIGGIFVGANSRTNELAALGAILLGIAAIGSLVWFIRRKISAAGLSIRMNCGRETIILCKDYAFIKKVILAIHSAINSPNPAPVNIMVDAKKFDYSVKAGSISNSTIVSGQVSGDVVNNV